MRDATENSINKGFFCRLFNDPYSKSFTRANIVAGFEATGIVAWNPLALPVDAFGPSVPHNKIQEEASEDAQHFQSDTHPICWVIRKFTQNVDGQRPNVAAAPQPQPEKVSTQPIDILGSTHAVHLRQMDIVIEQIPSTSVATDTVHPLQAMPPEPIPSTSSAPDVGQAHPPHGQFPLEMILPEGSHQIIMVEYLEEEPVKPACPEDPWKSTVEKIFSVPTVNEKSTKPTAKKSKITSHRVLTSDKIIQGKKGRSRKE